VPKGFPDHRKIVTIWHKANNPPDTDPLKIAPPKAIRDPQRMALALASAAQKALIPAAWQQLIPDEGCDAA
jgi:hypothetical protein